MLTNRPLYANDSDANLNVANDAQLRLADSLGHGHNTLLIGEPGSGKTTALHMVEFRWRALERPVSFVSLAQADDLAHAVAALHRAAHDAGWVPGLDQPLLDAALRGTDPFASTYLVRTLRAAPEQALVLIDDVSAEVGHALFGRLRDELWQLPCVWGVAAAAAEAAALVQPPAEAFFDDRIRLDPLPEAGRRTLLRLRCQADPTSPSPWAAVDDVATSGPGNPRRLLAHARAVLERQLDPQDVRSARDRRRRLAEDAGGRPAAMLVAELEHLGPTSASDQELLDRLGWTRPRAAEVMSRLEKAGILDSYVERRSGPGRPRKVYELRPPEEFLDAG